MWSFCGPGGLCLDRVDLCVAVWVSVLRSLIPERGLCMRFLWEVCLCQRSLDLALSEVSVWGSLNVGLCWGFLGEFSL